MKVAFHEDIVDIDAVCADLGEYEAVYWHTSRPNFRMVYDQVRSRGVEAISLCASTRDVPFMNFIASVDACDGDLLALVDGVSRAIKAWMALGEPIPHVETVALSFGARQ